MSEEKETSFEDEVVAELIKLTQRQNQAAIAEAWGPDFTTMLVESLCFCPSPDGSILGMEFRLRSGVVFRASMPVSWYEQFGREFILAVETAAARLPIGDKH